MRILRLPSWGRMGPEEPMIAAFIVLISLTANWYAIEGIRVIKSWLFSESQVAMSPLGWKIQG